MKATIMVVDGDGQVVLKLQGHNAQLLVSELCTYELQAQDRVYIHHGEPAARRRSKLTSSIVH